MLEIRAIRDHEVEAFRDCGMATFGNDRDDDPNGPARTRALIAPGRAWAAFDGDAMVATAATAGFVVGVPGATLAMAGLTMATVRPTHRRRGLLRALIGRHLDDARERGEPISGLWASEATIYGRFGYGIAAEADELELDTRGQTIAAVDGEDACEWVAEPAARARLPAIYARAIADRPGALHRTEVWWRERRFAEVPFQRGGASLRRFVVVRRGDRDTGYVAYRQRPGEHAGVASGAIEIDELIAVDARAEASLWRFVVGIDLFPTARWHNAPTDSALPWLVSDPRRLVRRRSDTLWLRIDDIAATLAARRYPVDGGLVVCVGDASWALSVEAGRGRCVRTDAAPELQVPRAALGSIVLGGVPVAMLARAGQIAGDADAVARAGRLFAWPVAAWCPESF
jgi:predicted acetyltransferase